MNKPINVEFLLQLPKLEKWVQCGHCKQWYHFYCVKLKDSQVPKVFKCCKCWACYNWNPPMMPKTKKLELNLKCWNCCFFISNPCLEFVFYSRKKPVQRQSTSWVIVVFSLNHNLIIRSINRMTYRVYVLVSWCVFIRLLFYFWPLAHVATHRPAISQRKSKFQNEEKY